MSEPPWTGSTIYTLGPEGTDAEAAARQLSNAIVLCDSFRDAMDRAHSQSELALVACGYLKKADGAITDTWVDLHYSYVDRMAVAHSVVFPTKPMCLARRVAVTHPRTIVLHPATEQFARDHAPTLDKHYMDSKPLAVEATARGEYDMCIGSLDMIQAYPDLVVVKVIRPQMVWSVYQRQATTTSASGHAT